MKSHTRSPAVSCSRSSFKHSPLLREVCCSSWESVSGQKMLIIAFRCKQTNHAQWLICSAILHHKHTEINKYKTLVISCIFVVITDMPEMLNISLTQWLSANINHTGQVNNGYLIGNTYFCLFLHIDHICCHLALIKFMFNNCNFFIS